MKRSKKAITTAMDGWLVPSKSSFDHISNQILVIGPLSKFDDASFGDLSAHLVMGDYKSELVLTETLECSMATHQNA